MGIKQIRTPISCRHWIGRFREQKLIRRICHCYNKHGQKVAIVENTGKHQHAHPTDRLLSGQGLISNKALIKYAVILKKTWERNPREQRQTNFRKVNAWPNPPRLEDGGCKCQPLQVREEFHYWCESQTGRNAIFIYSGNVFFCPLKSNWRFVMYFLTSHNDKNPLLKIKLKHDEIETCMCWLLC